MKIPIVLSLLLSLTVSAHATLVPGSEKGVTAPVPDVAAFDQTAGQLATDGDSFLAVWIDHTTSGVGDIHGARLSSVGKRVNDSVLPIAVTEDNENRVAVAYGGGRYLVIWSTPTALRARFLGNDAAMSEVFDIATLTAFAQPRIAFSGSRFLVVWHAGGVLRGRMIGADGQLLQTFDIANTHQPDAALVAANGTFHLVTAVTNFSGVPTDNGYPSDVGVTSIDHSGAVGARVIVAPAATPVFDLNAASRATEILIGWTTAIGIPGATVRNVRVTAAGAGAIDVVPTEGMYLHDVVADAAGFLFFYGSVGPKFMRRPAAPEPIGKIETPATQNTLLDSANNVARTLVLARGTPRNGMELGPVGGDLYVTRLDTMETEPLVVAPRHQSSPDIAIAGDLRLAVWCEYIGTDRRLGIVASRLDASGNALDINGIDLGADVFKPVAPRVASNGTDWLVVWLDRSAIYGARVAHDGTVLDPELLGIAASVYDGTDISVSWDGTQYLVVYSHGVFQRGIHTTIRAARVPAAGPMSTPPLILSGDGANEFPAIASGPDGSLIVWRSGLFLQGTMLSRNGTVTPLAFPAIFPVGPRPSVAWNNGTFLVGAPFRGPFGDEIQWQLVSATGVVQTPLTTFVDIEATQTAGSGFPTIDLEPYGDGFFLFWNGVATNAQLRSADVFAARINRDGILVDAPKLIGSTVVDNTPSIGAAGNTIVYSRKIGHSTREIARVNVREVQHVPGKPRRRAVR